MSFTLKNTSTLLLSLLVLFSTNAMAIGANVIDESITSKSPPYSSVEVKRIFSQCSASYLLMIGLTTTGPFREAFQGKGTTIDEMKRIESFYSRNGRPMTGVDFDTTSEIAYEKFRKYFNENNFSSSGQVKFLNEFQRIGNVCTDFSSKTEKFWKK